MITLWKCDPSNIQNCLNCQYAECRRMDRLYDPVSDELEKEVKTDIARANCRSLKQFKYERTRKAVIRRAEFFQRKQEIRNELRKGRLYGFLINYYFFFARTPSLNETAYIMGYRMDKVKEYLKQLDAENLIEYSGEKIRVLF